jgi:hypothetical protein
MKILDYNLFCRELNEEVSLNLSQLDKIGKSGKRGNILLDKILSNQPIQLEGGGEIVVSQMLLGDEWKSPTEVIGHKFPNGWESESTKEYFTKSGRYLPVLKDLSGKTWRLNQLKKTTDFGSSGPGRRTIEFETIQSIFISIKQIIGNNLPNDKNRIRGLLNKYLEEAKLSVKSKNIDDITLEDILKYGEGWMETFIKIPNRIWALRKLKRDKQRYPLFDDSRQYMIFNNSYTGGSPYKKILEKYRYLSTKEKYYINFSKYCPSDICMVDEDLIYEIMSEIDSIETIEELTDFINSKFLEGTMIFISFKKVDTSFKILINNETNKKKPVFRLKKILIPGDMRGIGSRIVTTSTWKYKDSNRQVEVIDRVSTIDSSDTSKLVNIDMEVEGKSSRHGKASFDAIKRIIENSRGDIIISNLDSVSELSKRSIEELEEMVLGLTGDLIEMDSGFRSRTGRGFLEVVQLRRGRDISGNKNKLISRIQSLQVVKSIYELSQFDPEGVVTKLMRYALSIETDKFDTPMYVRVYD